MTLATFRVATTQAVTMTMQAGTLQAGTPSAHRLHYPLCRRTAHLLHHCLPRSRRQLLSRSRAARVAVICLATWAAGAASPLHCPPLAAAAARLALGPLSYGLAHLTWKGRGMLGVPSGRRLDRKALVWWWPARVIDILPTGLGLPPPEGAETERWHHTRSTLHGRESAAHSTPRG